MRKIAAKWVPHALTEHQKWCLYELVIFIWKGNKMKNLVNNITTIDETWVSAYEPELKRQSANGDMKDHREDKNFVKIHLL